MARTAAKTAVKSAKNLGKTTPKANVKVKSKSAAKTETQPATLKAIPEKQTKTQVILSIAEATGVSKKDVNLVLKSLAEHIHRHLKKKGSGEFVIPEAAIKVIRKTRPATKKRMGRNPATGEAIQIAAKPAKTVIKLKVLKKLKSSLDS